MRARHQADLAVWALESALSATSQISGAGAVRQLLIIREHTLHVLRVWAGEAPHPMLVHLVASDDADLVTLMAALSDAEGSVAGLADAPPLLGRRLPGGTWPGGVPKRYLAPAAARTRVRVVRVDHDLALLSRALRALQRATSVGDTRPSGPTNDRSR